MVRVNSAVSSNSRLVAMQLFAARLFSFVPHVGALSFPRRYMWRPVFELLAMPLALACLVLMGSAFSPLLGNDLLAHESAATASENSEAAEPDDNKAPADGSVAKSNRADSVSDEPEFRPDDVGHLRVVQPFFRKHCLRCHGPDLQEGNLRVDESLTTAFLDPTVRGKWGEVMNVLNSHSMPPDTEKQPAAEDVAKVVDWITQQMVQVELTQRSTRVVLRRLNREEYRNTIRDLVGVDFDVSGFPSDPLAGGFDNNGAALTLSPMHIELYLDAARKILDRALVEGTRPQLIRWRFEIDSGNDDSNRFRLDDQNNPIVNGGNNPVENGFKVLHHDSWDKTLNVRDFRVPHEGDYIIRVRAGGTVPKRDAVVASARRFLEHRLKEQDGQNPNGHKWHQDAFDNDLRHFETYPDYDYGPPRLKLTQDLAGQPRVLGEFDVDKPLENPGIYETKARFTTQSAGITYTYAYSIPKEVENFWMQGHNDFARPVAYVDWMEIEGPVYESWPPKSHQLVLFDAPGANATDRAAERKYAREVLARFMRRAWRRPPTSPEVDDRVKQFDAARKSGKSFVQAIKQPLITILVSANFLYIVEPEVAATRKAKSAVQMPANGKGKSVANKDKAAGTAVAAAMETESVGKAGSSKSSGKKQPAQPVASSVTRVAPGTRPLTDYELATRLSYFLWSSMPDEELFQVAKSGELSRSEVIDAQLKRLLSDDRNAAFVENFAGQWLGLREVGANPPAVDLYPQYDRHLEVSIVKESELFFAELLRNDLSAMNLVSSDFVVINERLARFYGIPGVHGDEFRRVKVPAGVQRGGVVTQASVLTITSNGTRTSPVKRGTWVMKNLLGIDPGLPVANAGDIAPKVPGIDKATVRQRLEIHRSLAQCARCHNKIDPLGFALENFNAAGKYRLREGFGYQGREQPDDPLVDARSQLLDGTPIDGVAGLQAALLKNEDQFLTAIASKMFAYALGRELGIADRPHVAEAVKKMRKNGTTIRALITAIVESEPFRTK